jgi:hypothetical protein
MEGKNEPTYTPGIGRGFKWPLGVSENSWESWRGLNQAWIGQKGKEKGGIHQRRLINKETEV